MRKFICTAAALAAALALAAPAAANPDFGTGNSSAGPHDANGHCHPPGQTVDRPGCQ